MSFTPQTVFLKLVIDETHSERRSIYRDIQFSEKKWYSSDMVFMTVCNDKPFYLFTVLLEICKIRNDNVNAEHFILRESKTAVYDKNLLITLN